MNNKYYPILKSKRGEFFALKDLDSKVKKNIFPIFEFTPPNKDWTENDEEYTKTFISHIKNTLDSLTNKWPYDFSIDIDAFDMVRLIPQADRKQIINQFKKIDFTPCIDLFCKPSIYNFYKEIDKNKIIIRIPVYKIDDEEDLPNQITIFLKNLNIECEDTILLLDFQDISMLNEKRVRREARAILPLLADCLCHEIIIGMSSFPNISSIKKNSITYKNRYEYNIWLKLQGRALKVGYSDYTTSGVGLLELDPKLMTLGAKIKYTKLNDWCIYKGEGIKTGGYGQFRDLCNQIISSKDYHGKNYSWGDEKIHEVANNVDGRTGNQETWVRVSVNQHMTFVFKQLSN